MNSGSIHAPSNSLMRARSAAIARQQLTPRVAVSGRVEGYSDPEQVIVVTGQPFGLRVRGTSTTVDVTPAPRLL